MQAAVWHQGEADLKLYEVDLAEPQAGEVRVRMVATGVCHSDLHVMGGRRPGPTPIVLGHEGAGIVDAVGPEVHDVQVGDHVLVCLVQPCGRCRNCVTGRGHLCLTRPPRPGVMMDGTTRLSRRGEPIYHGWRTATFAEYTVLSANGVTPIRTDAPLDKVCLISCGVTTGVGAALTTARVEPGGTCLVIGCGGVGLSVIQGCVIAGATRIIAVDILPNKLAWAEQFGATHVIDARSEDVEARVMQLTGSGVDYAFEAIAAIPTIEQMVRCLRPGGKAVIVGLLDDPQALAQISPQWLLADRTLTGSLMGSTRPRADLPRLVEMYMQGQLKLDELINRRLALSEINTGFDLMKRGEVARSVVVFE
ncbi:MAG: Zn-dependent alcohol dehydrogenase [Chloroflexi bacterium]|nr:Zn-dependent alcohol dehydrogenase [Chloroflexota bacterium]